MSTAGWRLRQRPLAPRWLIVDLFLAAVATYAAWMLTSEVTQAAENEYVLAAHTVAVLHGSVVAFRRAAPVPAVVVVVVTPAVVSLGLGLPVYMLGPAVLFISYALGSEFTRRSAVVLLVVAEAALVLLLTSSTAFPGWDSVVLFAGLVAASWFLGHLARRWQAVARELADRAAELEEARTELARHAVAAERLRIAHELHDVVAHSMSIIAMHAGAARLAVGKDPAGEVAALNVIERSSREALAEMRRLVSVLRDENANAAERGPVPGVLALHTLVAGVVEAGMTVDVRTEGDLASVPAGVSLAAYRVVQEALTNVVRYAGSTHARLEVRAGNDAVAIRVVDDGPAADWQRPAPSGGGHGAIGMRERLELYGGTLTAGPRAGGGWSVEARLPYATVGS